jgi:hypothetical protein
VVLAVHEPATAEALEDVDVTGLRRGQIEARLRSKSDWL